MSRPKHHPDLFDTDIPMMVEIQSSTSSAEDTFYYEKDLLDKKGWKTFAGIDEAGRGALAGPVVAAAVILPVAWIHDGLPESMQQLTDSKKLQPEQREALYAAICENPDIRWTKAEIDAGVIDSINILQATHRAMRQAVSALKVELDCSMIDGLPVRPWQGRQLAIKKGDLLSSSIAAASIIAKVTRDHQMIELDQKYPEYGFAIHKGYGVQAHLDALAKHGPSPVHRITFGPCKARAG